jgi:hypothetical protein
MSRFLTLLCILFFTGCASTALGPDQIYIVGTITNLKPATSEKKGPSFDFVIDKPIANKGMVIAYEIFAFSMSDTISEKYFATFVGKKVRMRVLKSDLEVVDSDAIQLRTSSFLDIQPR